MDEEKRTCYEETPGENNNVQEENERGEQKRKDEHSEEKGEQKTIRRERKSTGEEKARPDEKQAHFRRFLVRRSRSALALLQRTDRPSVSPENSLTSQWLGVVRQLQFVHNEGNNAHRHVLI